ncbi:hypothetical protein X965_08040 [Morganella sp. EGD-HP17]|nr:hypothetical protein X965_08040 [Morganella sp. EGD-HP17]
MTQGFRTPITSVKQQIAACPPVHVIANIARSITCAFVAMVQPKSLVPERKVSWSIQEDICWFMHLSIRWLAAEVVSMSTVKFITIFMVQARLIAIGVVNQ